MGWRGKEGCHRIILPKGSPGKSLPPLYLKERERERDKITDLIPAMDEGGLHFNRTLHSSIGSELGRNRTYRTFKHALPPSIIQTEVLKIPFTVLVAKHPMIKGS